MFGDRGLERRLRRERPEARREFVRALVQRVDSRPTGVPRLRLGVALALALGLIGVSAAAGAFSYTTSALHSSKNTFSKVFFNQKPTQLSGSVGALAKASPTATTYSSLILTKCDVTGSHLNVHITGTSDDGTASDTITFSFTPSGSTTIAGSTSFSFNFNDNTQPAPTSVTATQLNNSASSTIACT